MADATLKIGDKVTCGFNRPSKEDVEKKDKQTQKNSRKNGGKVRAFYVRPGEDWPPHYKIEPDLGVLESILEKASGKVYQVRMEFPDGSFGRLRNYPLDKLTAR